MKAKIGFVLLLALCTVILMGYQDGPANRSGSGYTGAPGEDGTVCANCHLFGAYSEPKTDMILKDALTGQDSTKIYPEIVDFSYFESQ